MSEAEQGSYDTIVVGRAYVSGTKTLTGYLTGDPAQPIVPTNRVPATIQISAETQGWSVQASDSDQYLTALTGQLSGTIQPRTALDSTKGVCSITSGRPCFGCIVSS